MTTTTTPHYKAPGWFTRNVANRLVRRFARSGISIRGSRELRVQGRKTGEWQSVPVNPLEFEGEWFLVAPRGATQWVRNLRHAPAGELRVGRKVEHFVATEVIDAEKEAILRAYLKHWKLEVGVFFDGVDDTSPSNELARIAPNHPVFRLQLPSSAVA